MKTAKRKETSLKRRGKPGNKVAKSWKRETDRKKELREFEKSSCDSDLEQIPEITGEKNSKHR